MSEQNGWESINVYRLNLEIDKTVKIPKEKPVYEPTDARDVVNLVLDLNNSAVEKFGFIALNKYRKVIGLQVMAVGSENKAIIDEKLIARAVVLSLADGIILFHNHPSGDVRPSKDDIELTKKIINTIPNVGIPVYDHIIVMFDKYYSMFENDDCDFPPPVTGIPIGNIWT